MLRKNRNRSLRKASLYIAVNVTRLAQEELLQEGTMKTGAGFTMYAGAA